MNLFDVSLSEINTGVFVSFGSALNYFYSFRSERSGANLIQAQRDYFGAHTYQRIDKQGVFHTDWLLLP